MVNATVILIFTYIILFTEKMNRAVSVEEIQDMPNLLEVQKSSYKWFLAEGALSMGAAYSWVGPCVLLVSAVLTAGYLLPITIRGFFPGNDFNYGELESKEPSYVMTVPLMILAAAAVLLGMFPNALSAFLETIVSAIV